MERVPSLFETESCELPEGIDEERVQIARVWLYANEFYTPGTTGDMLKYRLSASRLLEYLIGKRVLSNLKFDNMELDYLSFEPREPFVRELKAAPVMPGSDDERASAEYVQSYLQTLSVMGIDITADRSLVSDDALTALDEKETLRHGLLKPKGRFATLPFEVANLSLRRAIEFYLDYGKDLVNYYLTLAEKNWQDELLPDVPPSLQKLGVKRFKNTENVAEGFFAELRSGTSLYQMLQVLLGAIVVLVDTLMARREAELRKLTRSSIVQDGPYFFLDFNLGKANVGEVRERILRPLPPLGAEALGLLARLSERLKSLGYEWSPGLFQRFKHGNKGDFTPYGTTAGEREWLRLCIDRFCDYVQIPTDEDGRRYYIRPHQLRRNFAMLFFWQGSFGGIEVLRYFLGHQKPSMTYRYVTETMKGAVLRRVKAKVAAELIKTDSSATESLAEFICERHGISLDDLHVLPEADVIAYIEDLLSSKEAEIEPEFVDGPNGEEYKILYKVCAVTSPARENNG
jgi:integrase